MPESSCPACGTEIAATLLACPGCGALSHADALKQLAHNAETAATPADALVAWRRALELLPPTSRQYAAIVEKARALAEQIDRAPGSKPAEQPRRKSGKAGIVGGLFTAIVVFASKFKFALLFLLTKGKLLLLGFTKAGTLFSMLGAFGIYWSMWGWQFAAGFILSIYVHEMGHVAALQRFGIRASAPMFIPGLGAMVRLRESLHSPVEDARVGLAGPWWGLGAAMVAAALAWLTKSELAGALAHVGAWINLFNLMPVWQLDGSRAFRALSQQQRWLAVAAVAAVFLLVGDGMVALVGIVALVRAFSRTADPQGDTRTLIDYCFLVAALGALAHVFHQIPLHAK